MHNYYCNTFLSEYFYCYCNTFIWSITILWMHFYKMLRLFKKRHERKKAGKMLPFFLFTKLDQMSRVGSRDRHAQWRSKIRLRYTMIFRKANELEKCSLDMKIISFLFSFWKGFESIIKFSCSPAAAAVTVIWQIEKASNLVANFLPYIMPRKPRTTLLLRLTLLVWLIGSSLPDFSLDCWCRYTQCKNI